MMRDFLNDILRLVLRILVDHAVEIFHRALPLAWVGSVELILINVCFHIHFQ